MDEEEIKAQRAFVEIRVSDDRQLVLLSVFDEFQNIEVPLPGHIALGIANHLFQLGLFANQGKNRN